jgi:hypothetical protein
MDVNEHEKISDYTNKKNSIKEQLVVRKDMDVDEQEKISNFTIRHKFK